MKRLIIALLALAFTGGVVKALDVQRWSPSAANNNTAAPDGWPENMAPSGVNDSAREGMAIMRRWNLDIESAVTAAGAGGAFTVTTSRSVSAYYNGFRVAFSANFQITGDSTLNVDTLGAVSILKNHDVVLASGDIELDQKVVVVYDDNHFQMTSMIAVPGATLGANTFTADQTIESTAGGAGANPDLILDRNSASPAADDAIGRVDFRGRNSNAASLGYALVRAVIVDEIDGTEDGELRFGTYVNGSSGTRLRLAQGLFTNSATGGDQGTDTINASQFFDDGVALPVTREFISAPQTVAVDTVLAVAHPFTTIPKIWSVVLRNTTAELGYSVGDEVSLAGVVNSTGDAGYTAFAGVTSVTIVQAGIFIITDRNTTNNVTMTTASWRWIVSAFQ